MTNNKIFVGTSYERTLAEAPPAGYDLYVKAATELFVAKSTDYEHRFLKGLVKHHAHTIWYWEVEKKLYRLRTWFRRGELQVKDEGVRNSVDDLFIYTVQYVAYIQDCINNQLPPDKFLQKWTDYPATCFMSRASQLSPREWVEFLVLRGLIKENELALQNLIVFYMGGLVLAEDWQASIKAMLKS